MPARRLGDLGDRRSQARPGAPLEEPYQIDARIAAQGGRQLDPARRREKRDGPKQPDQGPSQTDMVSRLPGSLVPCLKDFEGEPDKGRRRRLGIGQERHHVGGRVVVQVELAGLQQALERLATEAVAPHGCGQGAGDLVRRPFSSAEGLGDRFADARHLSVEGVESKKPLARLGRREEGA